MSEVSRSCPKCSTQVPVGADFCPKCGTRQEIAPVVIQPGQKACLKCGQPIAEKAILCPHCGASQGAARGDKAASTVGSIVKWGLVSVAAIIGVLVALSLAFGGSSKSGTPTAVSAAKATQAPLVAGALAPTSPPATKVPTAAPTPKPAAPTPTPQPKIGDVITAGNWQYQVTSVEQQKTVKWSAFGNQTDARGAWEIVHLKIQNIGNKTYPINAWDFEVKDDAGITYTADASTSMMYADFLKLSKPMDSYPPGVPAETVVLFDVNPAAKGLKLNLVQAKTLVDLAQ